MQSVVARSISVTGMLCRATMVGRNSERVNWRLILQLGNTNLSNWLVSLQNLFRFVGNLFLKKNNNNNNNNNKIVRTKGKLHALATTSISHDSLFRTKRGGRGGGRSYTRNCCLIFRRDR